MGLVCVVSWYVCLNVDAVDKADLEVSLEAHQIPNSTKRSDKGFRWKQSYRGRQRHTDEMSSLTSLLPSLPCVLK
eukprot:1392471-Amorphochlora_amoeboformis.AAC.1